MEASVHFDLAARVVEFWLSCLMLELNCLSIFIKVISTICSLLIPCRFIFWECHRSNRACGSSTGTGTPYHSAGCGGYSGGGYCLCETEKE